MATCSATMRSVISVGVKSSPGVARSAPKSKSSFWMRPSIARRSGWEIWSKATPITVEVNEPIGGTWEMMSATHQWTKTAAWAAGFTVPVKEGAVETLKYRVRVTY